MHLQVQLNNQSYVKFKKNFFTLESSDVLEITKSTITINRLTNHTFLHYTTLKNKTTMRQLVNSALYSYTMSTNFCYNESVFKDLLIDSSIMAKSTGGIAQLKVMQCFYSLVLLDKNSLAIAEKLVCFNVLSYKVVLISKYIIIPSMLTNYNLWHAFKGGTNILALLCASHITTMPLN